MVQVFLFIPSMTGNVPTVIIVGVSKGHISIGKKIRNHPMSRQEVGKLVCLPVNSKTEIVGRERKPGLPRLLSSEKQTVFALDLSKLATAFRKGLKRPQGCT